MSGASRYASVRSHAVPRLDSLLSEINQRFLLSHKDTAPIYTDDIQWIIVYKGVDISLWKRNGERYESCTEATPSNDVRYVRLKQLSHLIVHVTQCLQGGLKNKCEDLLVLLNTLKQPDVLNEIHADDMADARRMIEASEEALMRLREHGTSQAVIDHLISNCAEAIEANSQKASEIILKDIYALITQWEKEHGLRAEHSRAVVVSPHGPRVERIETALLQQWYRQRLGVAHVDDAWVYNAEVMVSLLGKIEIEKDIIQGVVINSEVNKAIGRDVLHDETALFRDVLSSYAPPILNNLLS